MITVGVQSTGSGFQERWPEFLQKHGAEVRRLDLRQLDWLEQIRGCNGIMWHWHHSPLDRQIADPLLHLIELNLGIPVFPNLRTAWHFDNKVAQWFLQDALDLPRPKTWVFWQRDPALAWCAQAPYPVVAKLACGAGSSNVRLLKNRRQAQAWVRSMFSRSTRFPEMECITRLDAQQLRAWVRRSLLRAAYAPSYVLRSRPALPRYQWWPQRDYVLFQEFLAHNPHDTRITVIGNRAFGFRRMNRLGDFRASGSGQLEVSPDRIDRRCIELAFGSAAKLEAQSVAFDFLIHPVTGDPLIVEFSYGYVSSAVHQCPGFWSRDGQWHEGRMWPEEGHVLDFLEMIRESQA